MRENSIENSNEIPGLRYCDGIRFGVGGAAAESDKEKQQK